MKINKEYKYLFIYKTTNLINGKIYVGYHRTNDLNDGYIGNGIFKQIHATAKRIYFHNAVRFYGYENFKREIIEDNILTLKELKQREIFWIKELNSTDTKIGYNMTKGGDSGEVCRSQDTKNKIRDSWT